jgi:hypothetical protein
VTSEANHLIYRGAVDKVISLALTGQWIWIVFPHRKVNCLNVAIGEKPADLARYSLLIWYHPCPCLETFPFGAWAHMTSWVLYPLHLNVFFRWLFPYPGYHHYIQSWCTERLCLVHFCDG